VILNLVTSNVFSEVLEISPTRRTLSSVFPAASFISSAGPVFLTEIF
jgi:hypothetical protein